MLVTGRPLIVSGMTTAPPSRCSRDGDVAIGGGIYQSVWGGLGLRVATQEAKAAISKKANRRGRWRQGHAWEEQKPESVNLKPRRLIGRVEGGKCFPEM